MAKRGTIPLRKSILRRSRAPPEKRVVPEEDDYQRLSAFIEEIENASSLLAAPRQGKDNRRDAPITEEDNDVSPEALCRDILQEIVETEFKEQALERETKQRPADFKDSMVGFRDSTGPRISKAPSRRTRKSSVAFVRIKNDQELLPEMPSAYSSAKKSVEGRYVISYDELGPRVLGQSIKSEDMFFALDTDDKPLTFFDYLDDGEVEEEAAAAVEEDWVLDREPYYERHDSIAAQNAIFRARNFLLQKKLAMFFKRKKMDHSVTRETDWSYDAEMKYLRILEAYGELLDYEATEKERAAAAISATRRKRHERSDALDELFRRMRDREVEVGAGLIYTKTGAVIPDKLVERLLRRQSYQMEQVCSMRLQSIILRDAVQEKLDAISEIDRVAPGLFLIDYEQLKIDNRSHADKIEEEDELLARLRDKCTSTIQVLAHLREKSSALENDLAVLRSERSAVLADYAKVREVLNGAKRRRDAYRTATEKIRMESGLLTEPTLLRDMEVSVADLEASKTRLTAIIGEYERKMQLTRELRAKIKVRGGRESTSKLESKRRGLWKGRPMEHGAGQC